MCTFISGKIVKTRKNHTCAGCVLEFPKGTTMATSTNADDGEIYTLYYCSICKDFMESEEGRKYLVDNGYFEYGFMNFN